ncbi:MAG TPA: hypothetical protein VML75_10095 [Kofleriaceae bacterium]|nr:hypothetical protein [Kofleriaceae bacterium]
MTKPGKWRVTLIVIGALAVPVAAVLGWHWWSSRAFDQSGDHWVDKAFAEAREWASDAELISVEGSYVRPDGVAELQRSGAYGWLFWFRSPARAAAAAAPAPEAAIPGAPAPRRRIGTACFKYIVNRGTGRQSNLVTTSGSAAPCRDDASGRGTRTPPRCAVIQVWRRAKQQGAPDPGYARIEAAVVDGAWRWRFLIAGHVELEIADDC